MSALLQPFMENIAEVSDCVVATESHRDLGSKCDCGRGTRTTRCMDCAFHTPTCDACFVDNHATIPLHWAEQWNGRYFMRKDYSELGGVFCLGHDGKRCDGVPHDREPIKTTILDLNGVHQTQVLYCECGGPDYGEHWQQLEAAHYFPASMDSPRTAFSHNVLKDYHLSALVGNVSALTYTNVKRRYTNNKQPRRVKVRSMFCVFVC